MGLFDDLFSDNPQKRASSFGLFKFLEEQTKNEDLEKDIDNYGLEDWQKELVRSGQNSSCDFEEEDLEKENFYHEDDKEGR